MKVMKFKIHAGRHSERGGRNRRFVAGDVFESDKDLVAIFGEKFERLPDDANVPTKNRIEAAEDVLVEKEVTLDPDSEDEPDVSDDDDPDQKDDDVLLKVRIERKGSRYNIVRTDTDEKLNEKGLTKTKVAEMLDVLGSVEIVSDDRK